VFHSARAGFFRSAVGPFLVALGTSISAHGDRRPSSDRPTPMLQNRLLAIGAQMRFSGSQ
jgi:hypothetical protein